MYIICQHTKLKSLVTSLALQQIREIDAVAKHEHVSIMHDIECTHKTQWCTIVMLGLAVLGIVIFIAINTRKLKLFRTPVLKHKVMLFISDAQHYIPVKLCRTTESIHLFKITEKLTPEHIKLKRNILWDIIEIDWKEANMTLNGNKINLPTSLSLYYLEVNSKLDIL